MAEDLVSWAAETTRAHLTVLPRRLRHVEGVAGRAAMARSVVDDAELLVAAGWLHDIGYSPALVRTGFHPIDGAAFLKSIGASERLCALVANHSCACIEARNRELAIGWEDEQTPLRDALWWADMTTTADGVTTSVDDRLANIYHRYGAEHVVARSIREAEPIIRAAAQRTEDRLGTQVK